jgi:hypothetical protein
VTKQELGKLVDDLASIGLYKGIDEPGYVVVLWNTFSHISIGTMEKAAHFMCEHRTYRTAPTIPEWRHYVQQILREFPDTSRANTYEQPEINYDNLPVNGWKKLFCNAPINWDLEGKDLLDHLTHLSKTGQLVKPHDTGLLKILQNIAKHIEKPNKKSSPGIILKRVETETAVTVQKEPQPPSRHGFGDSEVNSAPRGPQEEVSPRAD